MADNEDKLNVFRIDPNTMLSEPAGGLERKIAGKKRPGLGLKLGIGVALLTAAVSMFYFATRSHPYLPSILKGMEFTSDGIYDIGNKIVDEGNGKKYRAFGGMEISLDKDVTENIAGYLGLDEDEVDSGYLKLQSFLGRSGFEINLGYVGNKMELFEDALDSVNSRLGRPAEGGQKGQRLARWQNDGKDIELSASATKINYSVTGR